MSIVLKTGLKTRVKKDQFRAMISGCFNELAVTALNNPMFVRGKKCLK